jgi:hypothetical protein
VVFFYRGSPKPPGLTVFEGLFKLCNRSSRLFTWSSQNVLLKRPSKTSSQNIRVVIVLIFRLITKFLKVQDKSQVNENQEHIKAYMLSYTILMLFWVFSHLPSYLPLKRTCLVMLFLFYFECFRTCLRTCLRTWLSYRTWPSHLAFAPA